MCILRQSIRYSLNLILVSLLFSCGGLSEEEVFKNKIMDAYNDGLVSQKEWQDVVKYASMKREKLVMVYPEIFENDVLSEDKLREYILNNAKKNKIDLKFWDIVYEKPLTVKLYLESSMSVWSYDNGKKKILKNNAINMLQRLPNFKSDENVVYVANDKIYPDNRTFVDLIKSPKLFQEDKNAENYGNPLFTDFEKILQAILNDSNDSQLSILITDLIYSPEKYKGKSPDEIRKELRNLMREIFRKYSKTHSLIIFKSNADFQGNYWNVMNQKDSIPKDIIRPYYTIILGTNKSIQRILTDEKYFPFISFDKYIEGFDGFVYLSNSEVESNDNARYYTILRDYNRIGRFRRKTMARKSIISNIYKLDFDSDTVPPFQFSIAIDMSKLFVENSYLLNLKHFSIYSESPFKVEKVEKVNPGVSFYGNDANLISNATHIITISTKEKKIPLEQKLVISLDKHFPEWVIESSDNDDIDPRVGKTFGLEDFIGGIYEGYYPNEEDAKYFSVNIIIGK